MIGHRVTPSVSRAHRRAEICDGAPRRAFGSLAPQPPGRLRPRPVGRYFGVGPARGHPVPVPGRSPLSVDPAVAVGLPADLGGRRPRMGGREACGHSSGDHSPGPRTTDQSKKPKLGDGRQPDGTGMEQDDDALVASMSASAFVAILRSSMADDFAGLAGRMGSADKRLSSLE